MAATPERPTRSERLWTLAPLLPAAVALVLGLIRLDRSLWLDEVFNADLVEDSWRAVGHRIRITEPAQAVYLVLLKPWAALVGTHDERLFRLPSVLFAATAAGLLVVLGRQLVDRWTALIAGLLLATDAFVVSWSQNARTYTLAVLAVVVTTLLFVRARRATGLGWWIAYGVAGGISGWCHFYAGLVLLAHAVTFTADPQRGPWRRIVVAWAIMAVELSPISVYVVTGERAAVGWLPTPSLGVVWSSLHDPAGKSILLLVAACAGLVVLASRWRVETERWKTVLLASWVAVPLAAGVLVGIFRPFLISRYAIVIAPALVLLAAVGVRSLPGRRAQFLALAALFVVAGIRTGISYTHVREDWHAAVAYARTATDRGGVVAVFPSASRHAFRHYAADVELSGSPTGNEVIVLVVRGVVDTATPVQIGRDFVDWPLYTLREVRHFGDNIVGQRWIRR